MVFVKVRETYDLHTIKNKMTVIGIHTPAANIIKDNYPGLLMQCKAYRPVKCDVKLACASVLPLDPQGVGLADGDVAPEDIFNPILYKALSNFGMSNIDKFVLSGLAGAGTNILDFDNDIDFKSDLGAQAQTSVDQFDIYYGLLAQTHEWKHANPQSGLRMDGLVPLVYETYQTYGDNSSVIQPNNASGTPTPIRALTEGLTGELMYPRTFRGKAHPMPMLNCTATIVESVEGVNAPVGAFPAFGGTALNFQCGIPALRCSAVVLSFLLRDFTSSITGSFANGLLSSR